MTCWLFRLLSRRERNRSARVEIMTAKQQHIDEEITKERINLTREMRALTAMLAPPPSTQTQKGVQIP